MPKLQKQVSDIGLASSKGISSKDPIKLYDNEVFMTS